MRWSGLRLGLPARSSKARGLIPVEIEGLERAPWIAAGWACSLWPGPALRSADRVWQSPDSAYRGRRYARCHGLGGRDSSRWACR